jgi:hypothetical protein
MPTALPPTLSPQPPLPATEPESRRERWLRRPFPRLVAHFASVVVNSGQESGASELNVGIGGMLALLATPGGFVSIVMFNKYSSLLRWIHHVPTFDVYAASLPDKYFFIVFSMVVTGIVTVLKWDRIFPSRQDYANLGPLPIASGTVFLANLLAILMLAAVFAMDVNGVATVLFPFGVVASVETLTWLDYVKFCAEHAASVLAASAFVFFAAFALMGILMSVLPNRIFRKVSMLARMLLVVALIAMLTTSFAAPEMVRELPRHPDSLVRFVPAVWFLAMYQAMQGRAGPALAPLALLAVKALAVAMLVALGACALSYRRYYLRIPESQDERIPERRVRFRAVRSLLDRTVLRTPFERAGYGFTMKVLFRSETHSILFGGFVGFGLIVASQMTLEALTGRSGASLGMRIPSAELAQIPLALAYFLVVGLRLVFEAPAASGANWVYRSIIDFDRHGARSLARKVMLTFLLPLVVLPSLAIYGRIWGAYIGILHAIGITVLSLLLMDVLLLRFRKIPFTCTLPLFQNYTIAILLLYVVGFVLFVEFAGGIEHWGLERRAHLMAAPILLGLAWAAIYRVRDGVAEIDRQLIFEEHARPEIERLNILSGR